MKIDSKYLPSKRFVYSVLVMFLLVILAFVISYSRNKIAEYKIAEIQKKNSEEISLRQQFLQTDTDNDGLKDWEEALWQTGPDKADTDNDGTNDGDEVKVNRDPTKSGPNDKIDPKILEEEKKITEEYNKLNATDKLSRDLFSQYIASRNVSSEMSETEIANLIQTVTSLQKEPEIKIYKAEDLNITSKTDKDTLKKWVNNLTNSSSTNIAEENEMIIFNRAIETENPEEFKKLIPLSDNYQDMVDNMLKIEVPENVSETHLKLLNAVNTISDSIRKLSNFMSDPVGSFQYIMVYVSGVDSMYSAILDIKNIVEIMKIDFKDTESGYWLIKVI